MLPKEIYIAKNSNYNLWVKDIAIILSILPKKILKKLKNNSKNLISATIFLKKKMESEY